MNQKLILGVTTLGFGALTAYAALEHGYIGVLEYQAATPAGWQVFVDLAIALAIILAWMVPDARKRGRNPWPYVAVTLVAGSFGPLAYLLLAPRSEAVAPE